MVMPKKKIKKMLKQMYKFICLDKDGITYIYFILTEVHKKNHWNNRVKIGVSADPEKRMLELRTGNPFHMTVWYKFPVKKENAMKIESDLHKKFKWCRTRGEWFMIRTAIKEWVAQHQIVYLKAVEASKPKCILRKR